MPQKQVLGLVVVGLFFFGGGLGHFFPLTHAFFVSIVPPWLPNPSALVYISGVLELLGVAGLCFAQTRRWAGYGLMLITVAVSPANIHMWLYPEQFPFASREIYAARLVLQLGLLWLIWWSTRPAGPVSQKGAAR